jgi:hypothetical protein
MERFIESLIDPAGRVFQRSRGLHDRRPSHTPFVGAAVPGEPWWPHNRNPANPGQSKPTEAISLLHFLFKRENWTGSMTPRIQSVGHITLDYSAFLSECGPIIASTSSPSFSSQPSWSFSLRRILLSISWPFSATLSLRAFWFF